jgi:hypothetical protein
MARARPKVNDEVLYRPGNAARKRRYTVRTVLAGGLIIESRDGSTEMVRFADVEFELQEDKTANRQRWVWLVFVPQGGMPKYRRSPNRHP